MEECGDSQWFVTQVTTKPHRKHTSNCRFTIAETNFTLQDG